MHLKEATINEMNAELEAAIEEGRRKMRQFEEKTSHQIDMFDKEVDNHHHMIGHKYSNLTEDLRPVSYPLWGVIMETESGHQIYKDHVAFDLTSKCPRHCACTSAITSHPSTSAGPIPSTSSSYGNQMGSSGGPYLYDDLRDVSDLSTPLYAIDEPTIDSILSVESKALMEGRKWGVNKYLHDDDYVSHAPLGIVMKKSQFKKPTDEIIRQDTKISPIAESQPNTKLVSSYWRRKWKIPKDW